MALHRRAGDDTARPVDRRHGASCATRGAVLVPLAVRRPHGAGLADPGRRLGVLRGQVPGRVRDDVGRLPDVLPRPYGRRTPVGAVCRRRCGRWSGARLLVLDRRGDARLPVRGLVPLADREGVRHEALEVDRRRHSRVSRGTTRSRRADRHPHRGCVRRPRGPLVERVGATPPLDVALGRLHRRRHNRGRCRRRGQRHREPQLLRVVLGDDVLEAPHRRPRELGRRRPHDRARRDSGRPRPGGDGARAR